MEGDMIKRAITENGIVGDLFHDGSRQARKAVVFLGGSEGGKTFSSFGIHGKLSNLVNMGYTLLSLAYFKNPGLPQNLIEIPLEYFEKTFAWLVKQPEVLSDELALVGGSKGAEASLILGGINPKIKAVAALSPTSVVWQGVMSRGTRKDNWMVKSSWTYQEKELPYVPYSLTSWNLGTVLFGGLIKEHTQQLQNSPRVEEATIPVEKIQGAILLVSGRRDKMWPSTDMSERIMRRLKEKGFAYPYQHVAYDSGHNGYMVKREFWQTLEGFLRKNYSQVG